jgi:hypothetical protein
MKGRRNRVARSEAAEHGASFKPNLNCRRSHGGGGGGGGLAFWYSFSTSNTSSMLLNFHLRMLLI